MLQPARTVAGVVHCTKESSRGTKVSRCPADTSET